MATVFISYSHKDEEWKEQVVTYLRALGAEFEVWDDERIGVSQEWQSEINDAIARAGVAVVLVTANFLVSKFIQSEEVPRLIAARNSRQLLIVPFIIMPCPWKRFTWIAALQVRPKNGRALLLRGDGTPASPAEMAADLTLVAEEIGTLLDSAPQAPVIAPPSADLRVTRVADPLPTAPATPALAAIVNSAIQSEAAVREVTAAPGDSGAGWRIADFQDTFKEASETIARITGYKSLHDELHTFEQDTYSGILIDYSRISADPSACERLGLSASILLDTVQQVRALTEDLPEVAGGTAWIDTLDRAHGLLVEAVAKQNSGRATSAVILLNKVLDSQPVLLNEQIVLETKALKLNPVQTALDEMRDRLAARESDADTDELRSQIEAISRLEGEFRSIVRKHNAWQGIERSLRIIETSIAASFEQLEFLWPSLQDDALPLFSGDTEQWELDLSTACRELDASIQAHDPQREGEGRRRFRQFRRLCGIHFYKTDEELRKACRQLSRVGESLELLVRKLETFEQP
ncbi:MAG: toll/interleukin-1 receptor domain-containing protein [Verrucomicrobiota bacterium]